MQLLYLLLLLLATSSATATTRAQTTTLEGKTHRNDPEHLEAASPDDVKTSNLGQEGGEERGNYLFYKKIEGLLRQKSTGLSTKLDSTRKNLDIVAALERNPTVKKLGDAIAKDPKLLTKLENNPEAVKKLATNPDFKKAATTLENAGFTKKAMNKLRSALSKDDVSLTGVGLGAVMFVAPIVFIVLAIMRATRFSK